MAVAKMIRCQICGVAMRKNRMQSHIDKVHINPGGPIVRARTVQLDDRPRPKKLRESAAKPQKPGAG